MSARDLVAEERSDLVAFLRTLSPEEWDTPSLCAGWRVRDVIAHLLYDTMPIHRYAAEAVASGFSANRMNTRAVKRGAALTTSDLVDALERSADRGLIKAVAPRIALSDALVHHQDIRRPLHRPRSIPAERLREVLEHPDPFAVSRSRTKGLRFVAADVDWAHGDGPEVRGTGEAIALAVAGRPTVLDELEGDGVAVLRTRLS